MARLVEWTPAKIKGACNVIFMRMATGESVRMILNTESDDLPSRKTFYEWIAADKELSDHYARIMEVRSDNMADEILEIADNVGKDMVILPDGREVVDNAVVQRDRLRVDTRKWLLAKMHPKKYGDKIDMTSGNEKIGSTQIIFQDISGKDINED